VKTGILPVFSNDNLRLFKNIQNSILPPEFAILAEFFYFWWKTRYKPMPTTRPVVQAAFQFA
jgi:hypothetical protein